MGIRDPLELDRAIDALLGTRPHTGPPLEAFLLAFRAALLAHRDASSLTPEAFLAVLQAGFDGDAPAVDTAAWRAQDVAVAYDEPDTFETVDRRLRTQILDRQDAPPAAVSFPRRDRPLAHPTGYWLNRTAWAFVERGTAGAFGNWLDEGEGPPPGDAWVTWEDVARFLLQGQTNE